MSELIPNGSSITEAMISDFQSRFGMTRAQAIAALDDIEAGRIQAPEGLPRSTYGAILDKNEGSSIRHKAFGVFKQAASALTPLFAAVVLAIIGAAAFVPDVSAQVLRRGGGGVLSREFWTESNGVLTPTNPNATIGSSSNRVAGIYADTLDALTLTISGSVPGNLTVTGTISVLGSGTSTFAGDVSSTRFIAGKTNFAYTFGHDLDTGFSDLSGNQLDFFTAGTRKFAIGEFANTSFLNLLPGSNASFDFGASTNKWRDGWFSGTVTSTNFNIGTAGGAYRSFITGSASAPPFCFDDGTDGCNDGMYQHAVDGISFTTNGSQKLRIGTTAVQILAGFDFTGTSAGTSNLGSQETPFGQLFTQSVSTTNLNVATSSAATAAFYVCATANGDIYRKSTACN